MIATVDGIVVVERIRYLPFYLLLLTWATWWGARLASFSLAGTLWWRATVFCVGSGKQQGDEGRDCQHQEKVELHDVEIRALSLDE